MKDFQIACGINKDLWEARKIWKEWSQSQWFGSSDSSDVSGWLREIFIWSLDTFWKVTWGLSEFQVSAPGLFFFAQQSGHSIYILLQESASLNWFSQILPMWVTDLLPTRTFCVPPTMTRWEGNSSLELPPHPDWSRCLSVQHGPTHGEKHLSELSQWPPIFAVSYYLSSKEETNHAFPTPKNLVSSELTDFTSPAWLRKSAWLQDRTLFYNTDEELKKVFHGKMRPKFWLASTGMFYRIWFYRQRASKKTRKKAWVWGSYPWMSNVAINYWIFEILNIIH